MSRLVVTVLFLMLAVSASGQTKTKGILLEDEQITKALIAGILKDIEDLRRAEPKP